MAKYVKYASYKATTITGLEHIPEHWEIKQVRYLLLDGQEGIKIGPFGSALKLEDMVEVGYKVYGQENVIKKNFSLGKRWISANKFKAMQVYRVHSGDILITMMGTSGKCEIVPNDHQTGIIDSHLIRLGLQNNKMLPEFFKVLIDGTLEVEYQVKIQGKGSIMHGLNSSIIKSLELPIPPLVEQKDILNFLDHETAQIDTLIDKQQTLIQLLKEKRQAVISHAVTKGLNPDAPMKDSGVEWLGEVPEHWVVQSIKYAFESLNFRRIPLSSEIRGERKGSFRYYGASGVIDYVDDYIFDEPTVLVGEDGANLVSRNTPLAFSAHGKYWVNNHAHILRPKDAFADYWAEVIEHIDVNPIVSGSAQPKLTAEALSNLIIAFPPDTEERAQIDTYIKKRKEKYGDLTKKAEQAIQLMQERRTALISAAVTGKIDVRDWQAPKSR